MTVTPLRNQVLVALATDAQTVTKSGLVVQRLHNEPSMYATVIAVGPEVRETRAGERVVVSRLQGIQVGDTVLLPESAVLAHVATGK